MLKRKDRQPQLHNVVYRVFASSSGVFKAFCNSPDCHRHNAERVI